MHAAAAKMSCGVLIFNCMDIYPIIDKYYPEGPLRQTLLVHSRAVADKALTIAKAKNLDIDPAFVEEAAMLHDIGIFATNAPSIHCTGSQPYICHGVIGSEMLNKLGCPRHALVCERHTGAGLTVDDIIRQNLPLPHRDMCPISLEEKLICYADKFYSKSGALNDEKPLPKVISQMEKLGPDVLNRFLALHSIFA